MYGQGGMPTSTTPQYLAAKRQAQYDIEDAIKGAAEQAGLGGTRWSTPLGRTAQDIAGRRMTELGVATTAQEMAAQEAAAQRMMSGVPMLESLGAGTAGLSEAARNRALQGAAGLAGLGGQYAGYDQGLLGQASGLGGQMAGQYNTMAQNLYNNWQRMTPENNPWLSAAMQFATGQGMPQQYTPGLGSQLLGGLTGAGMSLLGLSKLCG
jgi:hypothetical protein